jgi:DNA topoisomerase-1
LEKPIDTGIICPSCHKGTLIERQAKRGKNKGGKFYGCSNFPKCKYIVPGQATGKKCPDCGQELIRQKDHSVGCLDQEGCGYQVPPKNPKAETLVS